jgi:RHS repeat-associated protein
VVARYPSPRREHRGSQVFRLLRAGGTGAVVAEVEGPAGALRSHALLRDGSMNVGHVVKTEGTTSSLEATPRRWKAFGGLRSGSSLLERGYASQAREGTSGLVLMGARHYDPETGGFLQPDPLGIEVGELYAYAGSNPYLYWDPSGLTIQSYAGDAWGGGRGLLGDFDLGRSLDATQMGLDVASLGLDATGIGAAVSWAPDLLNAGLVRFRLFPAFRSTSYCSS